MDYGCKGVMSPCDPRERVPQEEYTISEHISQYLERDPYQVNTGHVLYYKSAHFFVAIRGSDKAGYRNISVGKDTKNGNAPDFVRQNRMFYFGFFGKE